MKAKFGFTSQLIDNQYRVFLCKIMVTNPASVPVFGHAGITVAHKEVSKYSKKYGVYVTAQQYIIRYCTMNESEKTEMQRLIGQFLQDHAMHKVSQKWSWLQDSGSEPFELPSIPLEDQDWEMQL